MSKIYDELMKKNFIICIPSRKRTHLIEKEIGIWKYFLRKNLKEVYYPLILFVREEEIDLYQQKLLLKKSKITLYKVPNNFSIADKRNAMLDYAKELKKDYLFIIDDDIDFYYREESLSSKYTNKYETLMEKDTVNKILLESVLLCNENYPAIGLPLKQGSQGRKYTFEKNVPIIRFVCYHVPTLIKENLKLNGLGTIFMSDRYIQMELVNRGYRTLTNCRYAIGDMGTGYKGGCSVTRNPEDQEKAARALKAKFPDYIELKLKSNGVWNEERIDCNLKLKVYLKEDELKYIPIEEGLKILKEERIENEI